MLVVTNQKTAGICRQDSISSTKKTKEEGDISFFHADAGQGVEGELAGLDGLEVMRDREDTLLHLAGVLEDNHLHALEVDLDRTCCR